MSYEIAYQRPSPSCRHEWAGLDVFGAFDERPLGHRGAIVVEQICVNCGHRQAALGVGHQSGGMPMIVVPMLSEMHFGSFLECEQCPEFFRQFNVTKTWLVAGEVYPSPEGPVLWRRRT